MKENFYLAIVLPILAAMVMPAWAADVTELVIVDAATDQPIKSLSDGDTIDLSKTVRGVNVVAKTDGKVGCVVFDLNGKRDYRVENVGPFALAGDTKGDFHGWAPSPGKHTISATAYPQSNKGGTPGKPFTMTVHIKGQPKQGVSATRLTGPAEVPSQYEDIESAEEMGEIPAPTGGRAVVSGDLMQWHNVTITFTGPASSETAKPNPYLHYRLDVTFMQGDSSITIPGYFAGDGKGGVSGDKWRVQFAPPKPGKWDYIASFRMGYQANISPNSKAGKPTAFDGASSSFEIVLSDKTGADFRSPENGLLINRGGHYLSFGGNGKPWIKGGPDIPENFLGYYGFDNTPNFHHRYEPHAKDWKPGDADWGDGKGRNIVGATNYIAEQGGNCLYFLPMNIGGDGKDTFPTIGPYEKLRYDNSKLDQWERLFTHAQSKGIFLHFQLAETETANEKYHDKGELGPERKLFYKMMVARFGHHNGIQFNIGEENDYGTDRRVAFAKYIKAVDPYNHPVATHTHSNKEDKFYDPLIDRIEEGKDIGMDMTSFQGGRSGMDMAITVAKYRKASADLGKPWVVSYDEPQPIHNDKADQERGYPNARRKKMWPAYMGGAAGFEWYVQEDGGGHGFDHRLEDYSEMEQALNWAKAARDFLYELPLEDTEPMHDLATTEDGTVYVLGASGKAYGIYCDAAGQGVTLDLSNADGEFEVTWFDPRNGGGPQQGSVKQVSGGGVRELGKAPSATDKDWAVLVKKAD